MSCEQRQEVMALLCSLPLGCTCTSQSVTPSGQFAFTVDGPQYVLDELRKELVGIIGLPEPGLRGYTLQEAYNIFGWRTYTNIQLKNDGKVFMVDLEGFTMDLVGIKDFIIYGIVISSGAIKVRIVQNMSDRWVAYVTLDELVRDWQWPDGKPCGYQVPSKSIQRREAAQRGESLG